MPGPGRPEIERRRSARRLLGQSAELHVGPRTFSAIVQDISEHGMGLMVPDGVDVEKGDVVWILARTIAAYAITGTVQRLFGDGGIGIEFIEVLTGDALEVVQGLPVADEDSIELVDEEGAP
jgi:hypothetical protein